MFIYCCLVIECVGDNDQISLIIGNAEEVKEEKINDMDLDADAVFTSEEEEEMTSESCRDEIECDPSKTSSTEGTTSPKISRNKSEPYLLYNYLVEKKQVCTY